jgi:hypothetical protein
LRYQAIYPQLAVCEVGFWEEHYAIALSLRDDQLLLQVDNALEQILVSPAWELTLTRWIGS